MAVGRLEIGTWPPRHQQIPQNAVLDDGDFLSLYAFIVHIVAAQKRLALKILQRRIVCERDTSWETRASPRARSIRCSRPRAASSDRMPASSKAAAARRRGTPASTCASTEAAAGASKSTGPVKSGTSGLARSSIRSVAGLRKSLAHGRRDREDRRGARHRWRNNCGATCRLRHACRATLQSLRYAFRRADGGAFAGHQVRRDVDQVIVHARPVNLLEVLQTGGSGAGLVVPVARGPIRLDARIDLHHGRRLREIVNFGRLGQAAQKGVLERHLRHGRFVGLVGGEPKILAQRIVVAVDAHLARWNQGNPRKPSSLMKFELSR